MGKRLTPEEREARIREYEKAKADRKAAKLEKRKARIEAYEKAKAERQKKKAWEKRGVRPAAAPDSTRAGQVKNFPTYRGNIELGDEVGFRWIGLALAGKVMEIRKERNYRVRDDGNGEMEEKGYETFYTIKENSEKTVYPVRRINILAKKVNGVWIDEFSKKK